MVNDYLEISVPEPDYTKSDEDWKFFGLAVGMAQLMEEALKAHLMHFWRAKYQKSMDEAEEFINGLDRKTLGSVIKILKLHIDMHESISDEFDYLLDQRNKLAHGFWAKRCFELFYHDDKVVIIKELYDVSKRFGDMANWLIFGLETFGFKKRLSTSEIIFSAKAYRNDFKQGSLDGDFSYYLNKHHLISIMKELPILKKTVSLKSYMALSTYLTPIPLK